MYSTKPVHRRVVNPPSRLFSLAFLALLFPRFSFPRSRSICPPPSKLLLAVAENFRLLSLGRSQAQERTAAPFASNNGIEGRSDGAAGHRAQRDHGRRSDHRQQVPLRQRRLRLHGLPILRPFRLHRDRNQGHAPHEHVPVQGREHRGYAARRSGKLLVCVASGAPGAGGHLCRLGCWWFCCVVCCRDRCFPWDS